jgi:golgi to ER traffic protein 4
MTSKIDRIIARLQKRIAEGQPEEQYEAQQETRLVAARYTKTNNWAAAIDILSSVSQALLKAGQGGSGGDLAILLVDVYKQSSTNPDATSKGRLLTCLRLFDSEEPTRKKFIKEMME